MVDVASQTFHMVSKELANTIQEARTGLEQFVENQSRLQSLSQTADCLHTAQGVLRMVEIYGAALLAEEMEGVSRYLLKNAGRGKNQADALDSLTRAMVQLPTYLDRVQSGGRDIALVLLPLLNDLRAVRGHHLLSEGTLLMLNLHSDHTGLSEDRQEGNVAELARRLRPKFQTSLLGWIRGEQADANLKHLAAVAEALEMTATNPNVFQLWWVVGGVIESLREGGLETSVSVKRLLAQADRQIKQLIDRGEKMFTQDTALELLNNLLYYVARSTSRGKKVSSIRNSFQLGEVLPADEQIEIARESLSAPSVKLMKTVAAAIKEDLTGVKDVLDIYVRTGKKNVAELEPQLEMLKKISDTLGVLGLGGLRADIQSESAQLQEIIAKGTAADDMLIQMAATLLNVEDSLDEQLVRLILPLKELDEDAAGIEEDIEFRQVTKAVVRECIINLARVKEAVTQTLADPQDAHVMDKVPHLLRGITAGLLMLGKTRAVGLVERIGTTIRSSLQPGIQRLTDNKLDRLADAIVSVEYYMETVQSGRSDPWYMLDNAQACLAALEQTQAAQEMPLAMGDEVKSFARTVSIPPAGKPAEKRPAATPPEGGPKRGVKAEAEFLELFIEEAKEEIASIQNEFPKWAEDPAKAEALAVVRRSFHTLKGSGRMVGADVIGEFAWSIEDLLNRVINGTLSRTNDMVEFLSRAVRALPQLVEQLESGAEPAADVDALSAEARNFTEPELSGETTSVPVIEGEPSRSTIREPAPEEDSQIQPLDPVLQEIFTKESADHLEVIKHYLEQCRLESPPYVVSEPFYRSCHTLNGSANMAGVAPAVKVAGPLNRYVRKLYDHGLPLSEGARAACAEVVSAFEEILRHINESTGYFRDHDHLVHAFQHLEAEADQAIAAQQHESGETSQVQVLKIETPAEQPEEDSASASGVAPALFDAEIAAIFSEEASELLDATDEALRAWMSNQRDVEGLAELKRHLHTIKGGARMAGVTTMGDLSHDLESLFVGIQAGDVAVDEKLKALLQQSVDELHRMRDLVAAGQPVPPAPELSTRIRRYSEPEPLGEEVVEPPAPEPEAPGGPVGPAIEVEELTLEDELAAPPDAIEDTEETVPEEPSVEEAPPVAEQPEMMSPAEEDKIVEMFSGEAQEPEAPVGETPEAPVEAEREILEQIIEESLGDGEPAHPPAEQPGAAPAWGGPPASPTPREVVRINAELLETLLNNAGEITIFRSRLEQQIKSIEFNLNELSQTVLRLKDQLRTMEMETEAQILNRHQEEVVHAGDFDPLELDRYSTIQQMSRALAESVSDVASIKDLVDNHIQESTTLLTQQARVTTELQDGLMRTRMVPFQRYVPRLSRIVRQAASETGKRAELIVEGSSGELDRQVLENMLPPFEHLIRNAVVHGIESPARRRETGKPETGRIILRMHREGSEVVIQINDDGAGLDIEAIKRRAEAEKLMLPGQTISDEDAMQLVLEPGFSTASEVTQAAGRGVGMDVVATEITKLGGSLKIASQAGKGATFTVRLPFTLAITQALIVRVGEEFFALPLPTVEAVVRIPKSELERYLAEDTPVYAYAGEQYHFRHLGLLVGSRASPLPEDDSAVPLILVRAGEHSSALVTDELVGSREIVVKSVGPQISAIRGISGATILGDGSVVMILDVGTVVRTQLFGRGMGAAAVHGDTDRRVFVLVVDDSITVRRVTQRLLERNGMRVMTAKDGVDAVSMLQEHRPDVMLLDIEMPRMDGYEVAAHMRNDENLREIPIIMVTSRVGKKHRDRAMELGVDDYLGKPYQENQLLEAIEPLVRSD